MTNPYTNPFMFPGMTGSAEHGGTNPLTQSFEMMQKAWASLGAAGGTPVGLPGAQPFNLADLERRVTELRAVEHWLKLNLSMLEATIQALEVQRLTLSTLQSFTESMTKLAPDAPMGAPGWSAFFPFAGHSTPASAGASPENQRTATDRTPSATGSEGPTPGDGSTQTATPEDKTKEGAATSAPPGASDPMHSLNAAQQAWWNALQSQFNQIATAAAASFPTQGTSAASPKDASTTAGGKSPNKRTNKTRNTSARKGTSGDHAE